MTQVRAWSKLDFLAFKLKILIGEQTLSEKLFISIHRLFYWRNDSAPFPTRTNFTL